MKVQENIWNRYIRNNMWRLIAKHLQKWLKKQLPDFMLSWLEQEKYSVLDVSWMQISLDVKMGHYLITGFIKMEITYICNDYSLYIDGKEFDDIDYDKQREICHKLVDKVSEGVLQRFAEVACIGMGEYEQVDYCETHGEFVDKYVMNI